MNAEDSSIRFEASSRPKVSIVVLGWKSAPYLLDCLTSLKRNVAVVPYEVVVTLNEPTPSLLRELQVRVSGIVLVTSRANRGFSGGCNLGVAHSRGEYVVLLNDDTTIEPGWLEALVDSADRYPGAGAIGSTVLNLDGSLQAAGAILWSDGTGTPVGDSVLPFEMGVLQELRRVDYCGGEALLVRRTSWDGVNGLSDHYYPAYYEDIDLCLKLETAGWAVMVEPKAKIRHRRGASSSRLYQAFLSKRNRDRFVDRWAERLVKQEVPDYRNPQAVLRAIRRAAEAPEIEFNGRRVPSSSDSDVQESAGDDAIWFERERDIREEYSKELEGMIEHLTVQIGVRDDLIVGQQHELASVRDQLDAATSEFRQGLAQRRLPRDLAEERVSSSAQEPTERAAVGLFQFRRRFGRSERNWSNSTSGPGGAAGGDVDTPPFYPHNVFSR